MTPELKHQICTLKSQTEIAVALGTKPQTVSLWLSGQVLSMTWGCLRCTENFRHL